MHFFHPPPPFFVADCVCILFLLLSHYARIWISFEALGAHWLPLGCAVRGGKVAGRKLESVKNSNLYQVIIVVNA